MAVAGPATTSAQNCADGVWFLNIDADLDLCAFPIFVETVWGPANLRSPQIPGFPGFPNGPVNTTFPIPAPVDQNNFKFAQLTNGAGGPAIGPQLTLGQNATVTIGCCCCVYVEVVSDATQCMIVNIRRAVCPP